MNVSPVPLPLTSHECNPRSSPRPAPPRSLACGPEGMHRDVTQRYIEVSTLLLLPFTPHTSEHVWRNMLKKEGAAVTAGFPTGAEPDTILQRAAAYVEDLIPAMRKVGGGECVWGGVNVCGVGRGSLSAWMCCGCGCGGVPAARAVTKANTLERRPPLHPVTRRPSLSRPPPHVVIHTVCMNG